MKARDVLDGKKDEKYFLLGNEAIVRGALEGGLSFAATYPGTPSSEIGDVLYEIATKAGIYFEFSSNEKVAMEVAASAAACGLRSMVFMKHVGLNVAADPFMTTVYTGTKGGFLVIVADDPSMHSSQNEQDSRYFAELSRSPMLEPADPLEAYEMMKKGFALSEEMELPVLVRTTTRVAHIRSIIQYGAPGERKAVGSGAFDKNPSRWVPIPAFARGMHLALQKKLEKARELSENSPFNREESLGTGAVAGVITSGCAYNYVIDAAKGYNLPLKVLKLGMTYPLPLKKIAKFLRSCKEVMIVEELEPYIEKEVRMLAQKEAITTPIRGKVDGHFSVLYEYNPDIVLDGFSRCWEIKGRRKPVHVETLETPPRPPVLCPGCSHRATYYAAKVALRKSKIKDAIFPSDIGCYTLGIQPPSSMADYLLCMGSSMGTGCGISKATGKKVLSFIGDSTFFHSGIAGLINAYHNNHDFIAVILDNSTTAMTGHQPHPGLCHKVDDGDASSVEIEKIVRAIGIDFVRVTDSYNIKETVEAFSEALAHKGLSVIISRRACALIADREKRRKGEWRTFAIRQETCTHCHVCITQFACPAFYREGEKVFINNALCDGCGVCAQVCPTKSIEVNAHE
jgi:indolepyruvate ferredoxin oxidoreductase, alpha subunit